MNNFGNLMMGEQFRKMESTYSPKSSPHGGRSPVVSRQDSSGTLKTTISLGKTPTIIQTGPFYSMKEPPGKAELTGDKDLMTEYGLHHTLTKFKDKKVKESLSTFLPNLPGIHDNFNNLENSTLRSIIEKPPICGKELYPLTPVQLVGFRLHPGPLPEQYRTFNTLPARKHKNKHKKHKHKEGAVPPETSIMDSGSLETYEKKHKKQKRHEDDKERKKRKKEKKRKKKSHSPEPSLASGGGGGGGSGAFGSAGSTVGLMGLSQGGSGGGGGGVSGGNAGGLGGSSGMGGSLGGLSSLSAAMSNSQQQMQHLANTPMCPQPQQQQQMQQHHHHQQQHQMQQQHHHQQQQQQQLLQNAPMLGGGGGVTGLGPVMGGGSGAMPLGGASGASAGGSGLLMSQQTPLF